ncbi:nucleotidyl transferase AbiEii/AbiGii toxin family protein [Bradyrhizobium ottawaense]
MRDENEYGGVRIKSNAAVDNARVRVVIDIAFGDAIEPGVQETDLPVLLDFPAPKLRSYPRETIIAEKFQAMVALGLANSRLKDFYDVWVLIRSYKFDDDALARAIKATFTCRKTEIPTALPDAFTAAFTEDAGKKDQWAAFTKQVAVDPAR